MAKEEKEDLLHKDPAALEEEEGLEEIEGAEEDAEEDAEAEGDAEGTEAEEGAEEDEDDDDLESMSVDDLRARVRDREHERDGFRRDLFRQRERVRAARANQSLQELYEPEVAQPGAEDEPKATGKIGLTMGDDGELTIDTEDLLRETRRTAVPQRQGVPRNPAAMAVAQTAANYQRLRSQLLDDAEDPIAVSDTIDDLENAYGYLDRLVGSTVNEIGVMPQGEQNLTEMITAEGLDRRFERRFPGVDWKKLIHAPNDPLLFKELVQSHQTNLTGNRRDRAGSEEERSEKVLRTGNRPRSMKRGRRRAKPRVESKKLEDLTSEELLALSDDEVEELERATT